MAPLKRLPAQRTIYQRTVHHPHLTPMGAVFFGINKIMVKLRSSVVEADTTPEAGGKGATAVKVLAPGGKPPLALCSFKQSKEDSRTKGMSTPNRPALKAPCPKGSLPMARDDASLELVDMELHAEEEESKAKSNPKSNDKVGGGERGEEDDTSIGRAIASMKKDLCKVDRTSTPGGNKIHGEVSKSRKWKPIPRVAAASTPQEDSQSSGKKGAKFAEGTQFIERVMAAKKTPGKDTKMNDCIVRIKIKLTGGHKDIPASIMGMINISLSILHERDKKACYLNRKKSLEVSKATDFPKDFTDFYDNWGVWDERIKAFANNIPADKSWSFQMGPCCTSGKDIPEDGHTN
jgi:hypothetical protein